MLNIKSGNNSHNTIIYHWNVNNQIRTCNYIHEAGSTLQVKYLSEHTLYQRGIGLENFQKKIFYGISETKYMNHIQSFKQKHIKLIQNYKISFGKLKARIRSQLLHGRLHDSSNHSSLIPKDVYSVWQKSDKFLFTGNTIFWIKAQK